MMNYKEYKDKEFSGLVDGFISESCIEFEEHCKEAYEEYKQTEQ